MESTEAAKITPPKKLSLLPIKPLIEAPPREDGGFRGRGRGARGRGGRGRGGGFRGASRGGRGGRGRGGYQAPAAPAANWAEDEYGPGMWDQQPAGNWGTNQSEDNSGWGWGSEEAVAPPVVPAPSFSYRGGGRGYNNRGGAAVAQPVGPSGAWGGRGGRGNRGRSAEAPPFASGGRGVGGRGAPPVAPMRDASVPDRTRAYRNASRDAHAPTPKQLAARPSAMDFPALPSSSSSSAKPASAESVSSAADELVKKEKKKPRKQEGAVIPSLFSIALDVIGKFVGRAIPNRSDALHRLPAPVAERLLSFLKTKGHVTNPLIRLFFTPATVSLDLRQVALSTETLMRIPRDCPLLRKLDLSGAAPVITNAALKRLFSPKDSLVHLEELNLSDCHYITDVGLKSLAGRKALRSLTLTNCRNITDSGIAELKDCDNLQRVTLNGCAKLTDTSVSALAEHFGHCLTLVDLSNIPGVTEKSLQLLGERCQMLEHLYMMGARLAAGAVQEFKRSAPHVKDAQFSSMLCK